MSEKVSTEMISVEEGVEREKVRSEDDVVSLDCERKGDCDCASKRTRANHHLLILFCKEKRKEVSLRNDISFCCHV